MSKFEACCKIKPLSVNEVWKGRRFKTQAYKDYELQLSYMLPKLKLPPPPYVVSFVFAFSSKGADIDNPVKPFLDVLQKVYNFNDKEVVRLIVDKKIVKKGDEYISFNLTKAPSF